MEDDKPQMLSQPPNSTDPNWAENTCDVPEQA